MHPSDSITHTPGTATHDDYVRLRDTVARCVAAATATGDKIFTTNATDLWETYVGHLPVELRQEHNCRTCRLFIERFGGLVTVDEEGRRRPVAWPEHASDASLYGTAVHALYGRVAAAGVTGLFLTQDEMWGQAETGDWTHLYGIPNAQHVHRSATQSPYQASAVVRESVLDVHRALREFSLTKLNEAAALLRSGALNRPEKVLPNVEWLIGISDLGNGNSEETKALLWRAVANAPAGFCHPRAGMVGQLMEDLVAGLSVNIVTKKFNAAMDPLQYQRPTAAPKAGTIDQAEKLLEQLGAVRSLERRFARVEEVELFWKPAAAPNQPGGVFDHLRQPDLAKTAAPGHVAGGVMTWQKFQRLVLPTALRIAVRIPTSGNFTGTLTAVHADAPLLFQWDNPVSQYVFHRGSPATRWSLRAGSFVAIAGLMAHPAHWGGVKRGNHHECVTFVISEAQSQAVSSALFPEILRSEFHGVRSVIEAHSEKTKAAGHHEGTANGLRIGAGEAGEVNVRVTVAGGSTVDYKIDRWD